MVAELVHTHPIIRFPQVFNYVALRGILEIVLFTNITYPSS